MEFSSLFYPIAILCILLIALAVLATRSRAPSSEHRKAVAQIDRFLKKSFSSKDYQLFDDIVLEAESGIARVDKLIISQFGLFVVEISGAKGRMYGSPEEKMWTLKRSSKVLRYKNPLYGNYHRKKIVQAVAGVDLNVIHSVVVFANDCKFQTTIPDNIVNGSGLVAFIRSKTETVLIEPEVASIGKLLNANRLAPAQSEERQRLKEQIGNAGIDTPIRGILPILAGVAAGVGVVVGGLHYLDSLGQLSAIDAILLGSTSHPATSQSAQLDLRGKQNEWLDFYTPSEGCNNPSGEAMRLTCATEYIASRRAFNEYWQASRKPRSAATTTDAMPTSPPNTIESEGSELDSPDASSADAIVSVEAATRPPSADQCSVLLQDCNENANGCVSLRVPSRTMICIGKNCTNEPSEVSQVLNGAGINLRRSVASDSRNIGACIGFRADLGGSEAGVECLSLLLGDDYLANGRRLPDCPPDNLPYTVYGR